LAVTAFACLRLQRCIVCSLQALTGSTSDNHGPRKFIFCWPLLPSISERGYRMSQAGSSCSTMCSYQPHQRREFFTLVQRLSSYRHTRVICHGHPPCQRFGYYWLCSHYCSAAFHCLISSSAWIAISGL